MGAIGALLDHLVRLRAVGELDDCSIGGLEIRGIEYLSLRDVMQVNSDALYSLQIFDEESHASVHSDKTKEGLSVFGILNNTRTILGKALLREWLLRPSTSIPVINARHEAVSCFVNPENVSIVSSMQTHLKGIKNVPKILAIMRTGKAQVADWQGLVTVRGYLSLELRVHDNCTVRLPFGYVTGLSLGAQPCRLRADRAESLSTFIFRLLPLAYIISQLVDALEVASFKDIGNAVNETVRNVFAHTACLIWLDRSTGKNRPTLHVFAFAHT